MRGTQRNVEAFANVAIELLENVEWKDDREFSCTVAGTYRFVYRHSFGTGNQPSGLFLVESCAQCGRDLEFGRIDGVEMLGHILLRGDLPFHYCGEWEGDRNYAPREAPRIEKPRTVTKAEAALLDALRTFVINNGGI
jgi:hypothetical protein